MRNRSKILITASMITDLDLSDNKGANKIVTRLCDLLKSKSRFNSSDNLHI